MRTRTGAKTAGCRPEPRQAHPAGRSGKECMVRPRLASMKRDRLHSLRKCIRPVCGTSRSLAMMGYAHDRPNRLVQPLTATFLLKFRYLGRRNGIVRFSIQTMTVLDAVFANQQQMKRLDSALLKPRLSTVPNLFIYYEKTQRQAVQKIKNLFCLAIVYLRGWIYPTLRSPGA